MLIRTPHPDASLDNVQVDAYRNLRAGGYSLRDRKTGRVVAIVDAVTLRDAKFVVQPAGRTRVLATGRKQVHAFVRGTVNAPTVPSPHSCTPDELVWLGRCIEILHILADRRVAMSDPRPSVGTPAPSSRV